MRSSAEHYKSAIGKSIHRRDFYPAGRQKIRAGLLVVHGLGEHAGCYAELIEKTFASRGVVSSGADFTGHGESPGVRGDFGTFDDVSTIISETALHLRNQIPNGVPLGIFGHSLGGFHALLHLQLQSDPAVDYDFAWISSPVIDPVQGRSGVVRFAAQILGMLWPTFRFDAGIRPELLSHREEEPEIGETNSNAVKTGYDMCHTWITARYVVELLRLRRVLGAHPLPGSIDMLMTHGSEDSLTLPALSREFFDSMQLENKVYKTFDGFLHEPFNDDRRDLVYDCVGRWLDKSVLPAPGC